MSTMGKLQIMLLLLIAAFSGCSESDEREYMGKNSIYIRTEGDPVILAMDNEPLKATLMLIREIPDRRGGKLGDRESCRCDHSGGRKECGF